MRIKIIIPRSWVTDIN